MRTVKIEFEIKEGDLVFAVMWGVGLILCAIALFIWHDISSYNDLPIEAKVMVISSGLFALAGLITSIIINTIERQNTQEVQ
jgi:hypothetical protein